MKKILYHYSNKKFKKINPKYFGYNSYTKNDSKYTCKRFFCYGINKIPEYNLEDSQYKYVIEVSKNKIYNLDKDKLNLKEKFSYDIDKLLKYLSENFIGAVYNVGFDCYIIFRAVEPVKIFEKNCQKWKPIQGRR